VSPPFVPSSPFFSQRNRFGRQDTLPSSEISPPSSTRGRGHTTSLAKHSLLSE
jgi:hypothetical protein